MSSMRNAVQRRNHRERAQPLERQKWGLLEKHKDYSLRARDHNEKKRRMKALRQKAEERNPDEFAFGMMSSTTKGGIKIAERGRENGTTASLSMDVVKLLKTQDLGYLQTVLQQTRREKERVEKEAIVAGVGVDVDLSKTLPGRRRTFDEEGNPMDTARIANEELDDDDDVDVQAHKGLSPDKVRLERRKRRGHEVLGRRLEILASREKDLALALDRLHDQRAQMHGNIGGTNKNGTKFKIRERKR